MKDCSIIVTKSCLSRIQPTTKSNLRELFCYRLGLGATSLGKKFLVKAITTKAVSILKIVVSMITTAFTNLPNCYAMSTSVALHNLRQGKKLFLRMELSIMANGEATISMGTEFKSGQMVHVMRGCGKIAKRVGKVNSGT